ncbi:hypothetical protein ACJX0J_039748, partial [Zea mays]
IISEGPLALEVESMFHTSLFIVILFNTVSFVSTYPNVNLCFSFYNVLYFSLIIFILEKIIGTKLQVKHMKILLNSKRRAWITLSVVEIKF